jgi:3D (Asp-Asp-Asp) domain-containing protein
MLLSRSTGRKVVVTVVAAVSFASLYEVTTLDSRRATQQLELRESTAAPAPGARLRFAITGYCKGTTTASGVNVRSGIAASDPDLLPVGSVVQIDRLGERYNGIYTIMDTGPAVQGRKLDLYMWSCNEALTFGRQDVRLTIVRMGWNPRATTRSFMDRLFRPEPPEDPQPEPEALSDGAADAQQSQ